MADTMSTYQTLNQLGFSRSQTGLYLEFLKSGPASIAQTARALNTSRQAVYLLLPELMSRGLIKEVAQGKRSLYQALHPSQLFILVDDIKTKLEAIVPELTNIQTAPAEVPLITIYDSPLSMREWYRNFLEKVEEGDEFLLYSSGNLDNWYRLDQKFYENYMRERGKKHVKLLCLIGDTKGGQEHKKETGWTISEYRYTSSGFSPKVEQWIWRNCICYLTRSGEQSSLIVLQSENLSKFAHAQFYEIWDKAKKLRVA